MRAGDLDRRIVIEQVSLSANTFGGKQAENWSTFATVWAQEKPINSSERFSSQQKLSSRVSRFLIRWQTGITEKMRINYDSKIWRILGLQEVSRRVGIEILAEVLD